MARVQGKVAIVTGGARGQGASHARLLVKEGAKVVITDVLEAEGKTLAAELGDNAVFVKHDVTSTSDWEMVVKLAEEKFGPVTVLVNNAGISGDPTPLEDTSIDAYKRIVAINQDGVFYGMKYVIPSMKKAGKGSIVNISSISGLVGNPGAVGYNASKFAVRGMTKSAALELGPFGIRVNSIHPGLIETPMIRQGSVKDSIDELAVAVPMKRIADASEVSNLVLFLASDESSYSTGSEFVIDGGLTAQ